MHRHELGAMQFMAKTVPSRPNFYIAECSSLKEDNESVGCANEEEAEKK